MAEVQFTSPDPAWEVPEGVTELQVEVYQPGAGGADNFDTGDGGGGGGWAQWNVWTVTPGDLIEIDPGTAGGQDAEPILGYIENTTESEILYDGTNDSYPSSGSNGGNGGNVEAGAIAPDANESGGNGGTGPNGGGGDAAGPGGLLTGYAGSGGSPGGNYGGGGDGGASGAAGGPGLIVVTYTEPPGSSNPFTGAINTGPFNKGPIR